MNKIEESHGLLNVLCLEDDLKDAELLKETLIAGDYLVTMDIAKSQKEFADFLNSSDYDIIIADNSLPQFDALAALKMTLSLKPEIPFICVSGTIGEEKAIELLKQGACDCVIKGRLERMFFTVERALKENELEKERKQNEKLLKESEERFHLLFDKAPLGYQSLDIDGKFIEVNQQWLDTLGYSKTEVIGKWFGDFLPPIYQDGFRERFPIFKAQGKIHSEFEMIHKNGNKLFIGFEGRIGYDTSGNFKRTHCILQDITERKQLEENLRNSEMFLKETQAIANLGTYVLVLKGISLGVTQAYESRGVLGNRIFEISHTGMLYEGKKAMLEIFQDITERKHTEQKLLRSEHELKKAQQITHIGSWFLDVATNDVQWTEELYKNVWL